MKHFTARKLNDEDDSLAYLLDAGSRITIVPGNARLQARLRFICEGCAAVGELGVPIEDKFKPFSRPKACRATYSL